MLLTPLGQWWNIGRASFGDCEMDRTTTRSRRKAESGVTPRADNFEAALLGCVLLDKGLIDFLDLTADNFFDVRHRLVFQTCEMMRDKGIPIGAKSLAEVIEQRGQLDEIGGPIDGTNFLIELMQAVENTAHADYYAKQVKDASVRRAIMEKLDDLAHSVISGQGFLGHERQCDARRVAEKKFRPLHRPQFRL